MSMLYQLSHFIYLVKIFLKITKEFYKINIVTCYYNNKFLE